MYPPRTSTPPARSGTDSLIHRRTLLSRALRGGALHGRALHGRALTTYSVLIAIALLGFGAGLEAAEMVSVQRTGEVGSFDSVEIDSLPAYREKDPLEGDSVQTAVLTPSVSSSPPTVLGPRFRGVAPALPTNSVRGTIERGQSLASALRRHGVGPGTVQTIAGKMRSEFDFRRMQPGQSYRLVRATSGELLSFRYRTSEVESIYLVRVGADYTVRREVAELEPHVARIQGKVESSLYYAIRSLGEDPSLANEFADVFAWDIDFTRELREGDRFEIVYERLHRTEDDGEDVYVRPGRILAAHFKGSAGDLTAIYFEDDEGTGGYFRPDGRAIQREFLVAPLEYSRISSRFSPSRKHPILKVNRPHNGIDYAAAEGTPVWTVADGTVIFRGWNGGFGNLVKIRHANGYVSYYAHLSRFPSGLLVGQKVTQRQLIGYVGHTGLATGPHVCFRVTRNGKYVNPSALTRAQHHPTTRSVRDESWSEFQVVRDQLLASLHGTSLEIAETSI